MCILFSVLFSHFLSCFFKGPPDSPTNLKLVNKTASSISLSWEEGSFNGNRPVKFAVKIKENGMAYSCMNCSNITDPNAVFSHLKAFTTYNFTICSINSIGKACTDGTFAVTTLEDGLLCL